jgi:hypothetical protein
MSGIELSYVSIYYKSPVVYFTYKENTELGFPEIKELVKYAETLSKGRPYFTLSDVRVNKISVTEEGKKYLANFNHMPLFRGTAALVTNSMVQMAANFMDLFQKKPYPFKAFTNKEKALEWLMTLPLTEQA